MGPGYTRERPGIAAARRRDAGRHCSDMNQRRLLRTGVLGAALVLGLSACATPGAGPGAAPDAPDGQSLGTVWPAPPETEVIGQGTVIDSGGSAQFCLGAVMESYPPQCHGIALQGWSWEGLDGAEPSGAVTWGAYAVQGTYDGEVFTVTQPPILLALYDPMAREDPTGGRPGTTDEATLLEVQEEIHERLGAEALSSWPQDGRLWLQVVWDDGTWQDAADDDFGEDVVVVQSALRALG